MMKIQALQCQNLMHADCQIRRCLKQRLSNIRRRQRLQRLQRLQTIQFMSLHPLPHLPLHQML